MPDAADGRDSRGATSDSAASGGQASRRNAGRQARGSARDNNTTVDDSRRERVLADAAPRGEEEGRGAFRRQAPADRVRGWRDAARRTARRLTGDGPGLADRHEQRGHHPDGDQDHAEPMEAPRRPRGRPYSRSLDLDVDWQRAAVFGSGLALGALLGAGVALLTAPQSGSRTRRQLVAVGRRAGGRAVDAWGGIGDDLRVARATARRDLRRGLRGGRRDVARALEDLDRRALEGLKSLRDLRGGRGKDRRRDRERAGRD